MNNLGPSPVTIKQEELDKEDSWGTNISDYAINRQGHGKAIGITQNTYNASINTNKIVGYFPNIEQTTEFKLECENDSEIKETKGVNSILSNSYEQQHEKTDNEDIIVRRFVGHNRDVSYHFKCKSCPNMYAGKEKCIPRSKRHSVQNKFICPVCKGSFHSNCRLVTHMRRHARAIPRGCNICGKKFFTHRYLQKHKRTHAKSKTYQCGECGTASSPASSLKLNRRTHTEPQNCTVPGESVMTCDDLVTHRNSQQPSHAGSSSYIEDLGRSSNPKSPASTVECEPPDLSRSHGNDSAEDVGNTDLLPESDGENANKVLSLSAFCSYFVKTDDIKILNHINIKDINVRRCLCKGCMYYYVKDIFTFMGIYESIYNRGYGFITEHIPTNVTKRQECFVLFNRLRYIREDILVFLCKLELFFPACYLQKEIVLNSVSVKGEILSPKCVITQSEEKEDRYKPNYRIVRNKMFIDLPNAVKAAGMQTHVLRKGYIFMDLQMEKLGFPDAKMNCFLLGPRKKRTHVWIIPFLRFLKTRGKPGPEELREKLYNDLLLVLERKFVVDSVKKK